MKKLFFRNSRGQKLAGVLHEADSKKAVILLHGFRADKDEDGIFIRMAEALRKNGISTFRFGFAGCGESEGDFSDVSFSSRADDLRFAVKFMKKRYGRIGVLGASFGGIAAILGFSRDIKVLVLWNPVVNIGSFKDFLSAINRDWSGEFRVKGYFRLYSKDAKKFYTVKKPLVEEMEKIDIFSEAKRLDVPVLVLHGDRDSILPYSDSQKLLKYLRNPKKLEIIKGAEHGFHKPSEEKPVIKLTVEWFRKYL